MCLQGCRAACLRRWTKPWTSGQSVRNWHGCFSFLACAVVGCDLASFKQRANAGHNPERLCLMKARTSKLISRFCACNGPWGKLWSACYLLYFQGMRQQTRAGTLSSPGWRAQGGIVYSNAVTTVSPTYAREALDGGAAGWLRSTLARPEVRAKFQVGRRLCPAHAA